MTTFKSFSSYLAQFTSKSAPMSVEEFSSLLSAAQDRGTKFVSDIRKAAETAANCLYCCKDSAQLAEFCRLMLSCPDTKVKGVMRTALQAVCNSSLATYGDKGALILTAHKSQACVQLVEETDAEGSKYWSLVTPQFESETFASCRKFWTALPSGARISALEKARAPKSLRLAKDLCTLMRTALGNEIGNFVTVAREYPDAPMTDTDREVAAAIDMLRNAINDDYFAAMEKAAKDNAGEVDPAKFLADKSLYAWTPIAYKLSKKAVKRIAKETETKQATDKLELTKQFLAKRVAG